MAHLKRDSWKSSKKWPAIFFLLTFKVERIISFLLPDIISLEPRLIYLDEEVNLSSINSLTVCVV